MRVPAIGVPGQAEEKSRRFDVIEVSIELVRSLRQPAAVLRARDPGLHRQLRNAANSIALNIGEAIGRAGRDRLQHFRIALGSAEEVRTALRLARAWGDLAPEAIEPALELLDRIRAMLWRLTH